MGKGRLESAESALHMILRTKREIESSPENKDSDSRLGILNFLESLVLEELRDILK